ncbi:TetR family transcriptional regulator [Pyruvatibacter sp.]|uniref:TetR family transcriptional regulator n=1 Tax=Pyruvatibacter sp. TaxID=1981328 RepID=UPI0032EB39D6
MSHIIFMAMQQKPSSSPGNTKTKLIRAAERLFAENGLGAVSVRDITRAAGARNESALHYHFGSKEALIRAVFADRIRAIDDQRLAIIASHDEIGTRGDVTSLMQAAIAPMLDACAEEGGRLYATFLMQIAADPRFDVDKLIADFAPDGVREVRDRLAPVLGHLPRATRNARMRRLPTLCITLMADYARDITAGEAAPPQWAIDEAAACLAGFLTAEPGLTAEPEPGA